MGQATEARGLIFHAKALAWGGSIGIRISRAEADRLGIKAGQELDLKVLHPAGNVDLSHLRTFRDGGVAADDHTRLAGQAAARDLGLEG